MCIANQGRESVKTINGTRYADGEFDPSLKLKREVKPPPRASDVPLGEGLADAAKLSILSRRERIREAVDGGS